MQSGAQAQVLVRRRATQWVAMASPETQTWGLLTAAFESGFEGWEDVTGVGRRRGRCLGQEDVGTAGGEAWGVKGGVGGVRAPVASGPLGRDAQRLGLWSSSSVEIPGCLFTTAPSLPALPCPQCTSAPRGVLCGHGGGVS